jgi:rod shape-determining protein MreB
MKLFSFSQEIAIDLGTANTIIIVDGQIVVDEPSVVAIRRKDEQMVAVGRKAAAMIDHG